MTTSQHTPPIEQKQFMMLYQSHRIWEARQKAEILVTRYPNDTFVWKALGNCLLQLGEFAEATAALETAFHLTPEDPLVLNAYSRACFHTNQLDKALELQEKSLELEPDNAQGHYNMASMLHQSGSSQRALQHLDHAERLGFDTAQLLSMRSVILSLSFRFQEGLDELLRLYELRPDDPTVHNSLGNYYKDMADFAKAEAHFQKAKALAPKYATAYSNEILLRHYNPVSTVADIFEAAQEWHQQFACQAPYTHTPDPSASDGKLRVGIVSGSLRLHPVGWMITSALSHLPEDIDLYVYSDSEPSDFIAQRIQQTATQWRPIYHLDQQQVAERIHSDQIHILIDLAGHGADSRLPAIVMKPAPLIIKWVGMQISSMAIPAFDYFLSDSIETPPGVDDQYTEKLIRLPDDYVCYRPPYYKPAITALPAITNGYITLGCFNNPAKVNDVVLREWAKLMHELPNSRLFLKGGQYSSPEVCERIRNVMADAGITEERLILEGPSKHQKLLESYQRVDIALDPWPYSGGLTTCEAMLMGVPVVTLPGPTFAGRHSATHLANAGMQELVVNSWEEYRQRIIELASDLPSLAVIRASLRTYLEQSPVCDGERFARHLHKALRAIWQRHCEGKAPAALTFNKGGQAWFEDDSKPVKLFTKLQHGFDWNLESPVMILDNGASISMRSDARELLGSGHVAMLAFDPLGALGNAEELAQYGEIQHFPQVTLGNGQPTTLTGVEGEDDITSLKPLASGTVDALQTLEIPSIALDSIEGLESLDVLALDDRHDNLAILEHGTKALQKALLLQVRVRFNPTHEGQADLGNLTRWVTQHGFRFFRLHNAEYRSHLPDDTPANLKQASELVSADALFVPSEARTAAMSDKQRVKLAFMLHTVYGVKDKVYELLKHENATQGKEYLAAEELIGSKRIDHSIALSPQTTAKKIFLVGFPKSGTTTIQKALESSGVTSAHWKVKEGFVGKLIYKGVQEHNDPWHFLSNYSAITQSDVCIPESGLNYWPNLDFDIITKIQKRYPDCLFILNYRDPESTISSIKRWGNAQERFVQSDIPGLPVGQGDDEALKLWIENHIAAIRNHFYGYNNFLELNISAKNAPDLLGEKLGIPIKWWGIINKNEETSTENFAIPDNPHMSKKEADLFLNYLQQASSYFEFGSGGSTVWAVKKGLTVQGVESDIKWVDSLKAKLGERCQVKAVDIGPTREWGFPASAEYKGKFPNYSRAIYDHETAFDLILIDGRFRVACTMATILHTLIHSDQPYDTRLFIHDFWNRAGYHSVLKFLDIEAKAESAGVFTIKKNVELGKVKTCWELYSTQPE